MEGDITGGELATMGILKMALKTLHTMSHSARLRPIMGFLGIVLFSTANGPNIKEFFDNYCCSEDGTNRDRDVINTAQH